MNNVVFNGFEKKGFSINQGMAVDARLLKSASRPISSDERKKQQDELN